MASPSRGARPARTVWMKPSLKALALEPKEKPPDDHTAAAPPAGFSSSTGAVTIPNAGAANGGDYTFTASENGCTSTAVYSAVIHIRPIAAPVANSPLCAGDTLRLSNSAGTGFTYRWTGPAFGPQDDGFPGGPGYIPQGRVIFSGSVLSVRSGKALDVAAGSNYNGAAVIQYTFRGTPNQLWDVIDAGRGRVVFVSQDSNKVLDVAGGGQTEGAPVQQFRFNGNEDQLWRIERLGGGVYQIVNVASGLCLDVEGGVRADGARVIQFRCQGNENQAWRLGS